MSDQIIKKELEILSKKELNRTIKRLASQIFEKVPDTNSLLLVGIPTRGVYLSKLLAIYLEELSGNRREWLFRSTFIEMILRGWYSNSSSNWFTLLVDDREVILVDDVIYTGGL